MAPKPKKEADLAPEEDDTPAENPPGSDDVELAPPPTVEFVLVDELAGEQLEHVELAHDGRLIAIGRGETYATSDAGEIKALDRNPWTLRKEQ